MCLIIRIFDDILSFVYITECVIGLIKIFFYTQAELGFR